MVALLLGIGLRFEAASRARQENAERNEWLPVTAHVKSCFLVQDHAISAQRSVIFKIDCRFKYTVNGTEYIGSTVTIGPQHGLYRGAAPPPEAARMDNWARLHPPGSLQVIHHNPKKVGAGVAGRGRRAISHQHRGDFAACLQSDFAAGRGSIAGGSFDKVFYVAIRAVNFRGKPLILCFECYRSFFYGSFVAQRHQGIAANGFAGQESSEPS